MMQPTFGLTLDVRINLTPTGSGGPAVPLQSGYRPLCVIQRPDGTEALVGLCELELSESLAPGGSALGRLCFDVAISDDARALVRSGSRVMLTEASHQVGFAVVLAIGS